MHIKSCSKWINMSDPSASEIPNSISIETAVFREKFGNSGSLNLQVPEPEEPPESYRDVPCHSRKASAQSGALTGGGAEVHVLEYESGYDNGGRPSFEFCKGDKGGYKAKVISFLKPSSKWDDAEKWLVNVSQTEFNPKGKINGGAIPTTQIALNSMKKVDFSNQATDNLQNGSHGLKSKPSNYVTGISATLESSRDLMQESFFGDFPGEKMKKVDTMKCLSDTGNTGAHFAFTPASASLPSQSRLDASSDCFSTGDQWKELNMVSEKDSKMAYLEPISWVEKPSSESVLSERVISNGANEAPLSPQSTSSYHMGTSSVRSISMRDMGTEMTPIASQEPSRTATPIRATTPAMCSPVSSNPSTPRRAIPVSKTSHAFVAVSGVECNMIPSAFSEKDIKIETNQEALCFDGQIRKTKMMPWTNKEEEDEYASKLLKKIDLEEVKKNVLETRAAAWEAAEQAKNMARYKREEAKIKAWENHERSKAEAEMRRIEAKIERMRSHAHEKLINKLAATQERAEERLATAEARRLEHADKTVQRADHIRRLLRSGKSCRLRWINYLWPDVKRGDISLEEEDLIIRLHKLIGNWACTDGLE